MKFYTQYRRPDEKICPLEFHEDEGIVERAGYMSTEQMVTQLLNAGANLQVFREAEFANDEEIPDDAPAARYAMDRLDAQLALREVNERIRADRELAYEQAKAAEAARIEAASGAKDA